MNLALALLASAGMAASFASAFFTGTGDLRRAGWCSAVGLALFVVFGAVLITTGALA